MTVPYFNLAEEAFRVQKIEFMNPVPRHKHSCYELFLSATEKGRFTSIVKPIKSLRIRSF